MPLVLRAAGAFNMLGGALAVLYPDALFRLTGAPTPNYPALVQFLGLVLGVYGLAYWLAARDPLHNWVVVATGLLGKLAGVLGFFLTLGSNSLPLSFGLLALAGEAVWIPAFYFILRWVYLQSADGRLMANESAVNPAPELLARFPAHTGQTLLKLSQDSPLLVVFLRHLGCLYCREALADLARQRSGLAASGIRLAIVHQASEAQAAAYISGYGLGDVPRISDPQRELYGAFGLRPGGWRELVGWRNWPRAALAILFGWHMQWSVWGGRASQLPGVFLLYDGKVAMSFESRFAGDRVDFSSAAANP